MKRLTELEQTPTVAYIKACAERGNAEIGPQGVVDWNNAAIFGLTMKIMELENRILQMEENKIQPKGAKSQSHIFKPIGTQ